jgi:transposase
VERVAIERPAGILVERLLAGGLQVLAIHPNQVKAARPRFAVAHGKSDRFDAYVLAELARTDAHRFRPLRPDRDATKALRALTRSREDLVGARVELANQLRAQLQAFWPGALIFDDVDSRISLAFLARYPSPANAKGLGAKRMAAFLARQGYSGRTDPAEFIDRIKAALAADAGMSPVALESGKLRVATFRRACDKRLRLAVATTADSTRHWHPWAEDVYRRARARGQDHPRAIRTLGRAWIRVLWRCWQDGVPYDATLHGSSCRFQRVGG